MTTRFLMLSWAALAALFLQAGAASAQQSLWTFVASYGADSGPCSRALPCRTYTSAFQKTLTGGQITAIDASSFGWLTIDRSISIVNEVGGGSFLQQIIVRAPADADVLLQGVNAFGDKMYVRNGFRIESARSVTIRDCTIRNFRGAGVDVRNNSGDGYASRSKTARSRTMVGGCRSSAILATLP